VAKSTAHWATANYREAYGLFAISGILFNHESPLRPERFVTQKIVKTACRIAAGSGELLRLGNMSVRRDWGWAPEYVEGMWRMMQEDKPDDFILATGHTVSLQNFVETAFELLGLDWQDHVVSDQSLFRPADLSVGIANPSKAREVLGWEAKSKMTDVVRMMIDAGKGADDPARRTPAGSAHC
jgi:GDPmannose 4,6-dehydratase